MTAGRWLWLLRCKWYNLRCCYLVFYRGPGMACYLPYWAWTFTPLWLIRAGAKAKVAQQQRGYVLTFEGIGFRK